MRFGRPLRGGTGAAGVSPGLWPGVMPEVSAVGAVACVRDKDAGGEMPSPFGAAVRRSPLIRKLSLVLALTLALAPAARADDIADAIAEAQKAYAAGDLPGAKASLDVAAQLLAQRNAEGLAKFLPAAPAGWTAGETETDASIAAAFGGGLIAKREYRRGDDTVSVQILTQSPMVAQMAGMFANAQMLGAMGKVFRVGNRTAVATREGTVQMLSGSTFIIIEGSAPEADKKAFLSAIDLAALEKAGG